MLPSQVNEIKSLVIHDGIPRCATTAGHPPLSVPGLRGALQCFRFESARSIAGHCESSPKQFSSLGILGGNKTAHARFRPRIPDEDFSFGDSRRAGNRIRLGLVNGDYTPHRFAGLGI